MGRSSPSLFLVSLVYVYGNKTRGQIVGDIEGQRFKSEERNQTFRVGLPKDAGEVEEGHGVCDLRSS